jgi:hypothetical protein
MARGRPAHAHGDFNLVAMSGLARDLRELQLHDSYDCPQINDLVKGQSVLGVLSRQERRDVEMWWLIELIIDFFCGDRKPEPTSNT